MSAFVRVACCAAVLLLAAVVVIADQTGEIRGTATDVTGAVLPGVAVTARSPSLQGLRATASDEKGSFRLPLLPVGTYDVTFELPGFEKLTLTGSEVHLGSTASVSVVMKLAAVTGEITVTAAPQLIDTTRGDTSYRLRGEELSRIPTQARTIAEVVQFTPGVTGVRTNTVTGTDTGLPSFRGEGDAGNNWLVDGLSTKGVNLNDSGVRVNYDAWEEVEIVSDGFAPELGQAMGGFVNVVTKSGGNELHGEVGALIRDESLRAGREEQLSAASLPETASDQYFANLGGPILRDRLWFFVSDNYLSIEDRTTDQTVGWLDIPAGERTTTSNNFFGKVTFTPAANHTLSAGATFEDSPQQSGGIGVPETYAVTSYDGSSYRLNYAGIFGPDLFVTAAAGQNRRDTETVPLSGDYGTPSYFWQDIAQRTNNIEWGLTESERRTDVALAGAWMLDAGSWGDHEIKGGVSYYDNSFRSSFLYTGRDADPFPGNGFDGGVAIIWTSPGIPSVLSEYRSVLTKNSTRGLGFHVQDTVTFGRATLMVGLRTDTQEIFNDAGNEALSWGLGDFLQARASLAVDLTGDGRTIVKAGYGDFAMPLSTQALGYVFNRDYAFTLRQYLWVGPPDPAQAQLEDPANWQLAMEQSTEVMPTGIDPDTKPNSLQRMLLGVERRLSAEWALKLRGVYSRTMNLIDAPLFYDPGAPLHFSGVFTNFELKRRDYRALEAELNGRVGSRFFLDASYTWSRAKGTSSGNQFESSTWDSQVGGAYDFSPFGTHPYLPPDDPYRETVDYWFGGLGGRGFGDEGWYGYLPYSVDHDVKILATWVAPYGFKISPAVEWLSGYHWEKKGWSPGWAFYLTFPEGRGGRTTPDLTYVDLAVDKDFELGQGLVLNAGVNVYNLFNSQQPVSYVKEDTDLFGQVWARQLPLWVQLKLGLRF